MTGLLKRIAFLVFLLVMVGFTSLKAQHKKTQTIPLNLDKTKLDKDSVIKDSADYNPVGDTATQNRWPKKIKNNDRAMYSNIEQNIKRSKYKLVQLK